MGRLKFEHMKIRSFIFFGVLVLFGTLLLLGFDTETPVRETIMVYSVFVIFPFAWFYYEYSNSPYYFSDIIETKNLRQLYVPTTVIFILLFILSIGIVWLNSFLLSFISPEFVNEFLSEEEILPKGSPVSAFLIGVYIVIFAPITEEFIFRGLFLKRLGYKFNLKAGLLISSFIFGVFHFDIIGSFMFGIVLGLIYTWTNNLLYPILIHMANNLLALSLDLLHIPLPKFLMYTAVDELPAAATPNLIIIGLFAPLLIFAIYKYKPSYKKYKINT